MERLTWIKSKILNIQRGMGMPYAALNKYGLVGGFLKKKSTLW